MRVDELEHLEIQVDTPIRQIRSTKGIHNLKKSQAYIWLVQREFRTVPNLGFVFSLPGPINVWSTVWPQNKGT